MTGGEHEGYAPKMLLIMSPAAGEMPAFVFVRV